MVYTINGDEIQYYLSRSYMIEHEILYSSISIHDYMGGTIGPNEKDILAITYEHTDLNRRKVSHSSEGFKLYLREYI